MAHNVRETDCRAVGLVGLLLCDRHYNAGACEFNLVHLPLQIVAEGSSANLGQSMIGSEMGHRTSPNV